ncbi:MAG: protein kinase [Sandaracinus sp.]|nr:protein kinase [Sandaracinus sp.]
MARRIRFGSYELLQRIGEGGMAEVWRARARGVAGFEKTVVIKRVLPSLMARRDFAELLVREARIAALLNHPNVVQIFELGEEQGAYFIAMEYVHGCDLASAVAHQPDLLAAARDGGLDLALRLWITLEAAQALDYAHRRRDDEGRPLAIVHRDVSPQNVLLGYEGQVKVADFGIALADQRGLGREEDPKMIRGKYAYMSPEQARGEPLDRRSDVFALGVVLWEMLAGRRLFKAAGRDETLRRVQEAVVPPIDLDVIGAPPELGEVLRHALAKDREDRFPSAGALAEELSRVLVAMHARVGPHELREVLHRIAPPDDVRRVNKLRADLLERIDGDSDGSGELALGPTPIRSRSEDTRAFPVSRRLDSEVAPVVMLLARTPASDFDEIVRRFGGFVVPVQDLDLPREAVFGHDGPLEAATALAVGCAREILWRATDAALVVVGGEARVFRTDPPVADPLATTRERGLSALQQVAPAEVRVDPELAPEVHRRHVLEHDAPWPRVSSARQPSVRTLDELRRGPLVGRRDVLRSFTESLADMRRGRGRAALLLGAPGVGKSRLVAELRALAEAEGATTVVALPFAERAGEPYAALVAVFEVLCALDGTEDDAARTEKIEALRWLGASPREVAAVGALFGGTPPAERTGRPRGIELVVTLRKALVALAAEHPVLFVLEDLQAVDDETRQLLDLLVAGLRDARVLTLFTARPGMALPHLHVDRRVLEPLDAEATARLFAHRVGARVVEEELLAPLHHLTGGNPATVELLAESLRGGRGLGVADGLVHDLARAPSVPPRLKASVASRVTALPKRARSLLRTLAAVETPMDFPLLAAVEGIPRDVAEPLVQRMLARGVLRGFGAIRTGTRASELPVPGREEPLPARLAIDGGDLVRRAVLESLPESERERVHARIADVLRRSGAGSDDRVESLSHHAALAGDYERAPAELERAAEVALARGDRLLAAERLVLASRLRRQGGGAALDAAESCARAAELALEAGSTEHAAATLSMAPTVDDARVACRLALARARVEARREHWQEAVAEVESLASSAWWQDADATVRGRAGLVLGRARLESGDVEGSIEAYADAARELSDAHVPADAALALCGLATSLARAGRDDEAREVETSALVAAVRHGTGELRCASLATSAELAEAAADAPLAAARWADAATVATELGRGEDAARWGIRAAVAAVDAGLESEAARWVVEATRHGKEHDLEAVASLARAVRAALAVMAHPDPHFVIGLVRAVDELEALGRYGEAAAALTMLARAHLALGDVGAAIRTLGRAGPLARSAGRPRQEARIADQADRLARGEAID